jgi:hypothetical protein
MPVTEQTIATRRQTMAENRKNGVVRKQRAPMTEEAKAQMTAKRNATILQRTRLQEQEKQNQQQQEPDSNLTYHEMIKDADFRKKTFYYMIELEQKRGTLSFTEYVDLLTANRKILKGIAETLTVEFIVRNQFIKAEYGIDQPDPRYEHCFRPTQ